MSLINLIIFKTTRSERNCNKSETICMSSPFKNLCGLGRIELVFLCGHLEPDTLFRSCKTKNRHDFKFMPLTLFSKLTLETFMPDLELAFDSLSEEENKIFVNAKFERIEDFEETNRGEKKISYWHLISLKIKHSKCPHMGFGCGCYEPNDDEYAEIESEALTRASKEAA